MSEWWSYRPADFLLFSSDTYRRLFELYNAAIWPAAHLLAIAVGLALVAIALRGPAWAASAVCALLAAGWLWVAWAFHWQRYVTINWAASGFAVAFAAEALLLLACGAFARRLRLRSPRGRAGRVGLGLLLWALLVEPALGPALGRPWLQAELFGLAPDPTAVGTLGLLVMLRGVDAVGQPSRAPIYTWLLWPIPLLWCGLSGLTLTAMQAPDAWLLPAAALLALLAAVRTGPT
ncbi:MAG: DUF6064 family protein [Burkholderiaceae bacterium]